MRRVIGQLLILRSDLEKLCFDLGIGLPLCKLTAMVCLPAVVLDTVTAHANLRNSRDLL